MAGDLGSTYVLVDTNAFINLTRGRKRSVHLIPHVEDRRIVLSFVTVAELRLGAHTLGYSPESWRQLAADIGNAVVVSPDDQLSHEWARLVAEARKAGHALGQKAQAHDAWIAATATVYDLPILTEDGDFDGFGTLRLLPERD